MKHTKTYHSKRCKTENNPVIVEGPLTSDELKKYHFHEGLFAFRPAHKQFEAILNIAELPEGRILVARTEDTIIGYVTFLHPDPLERWSKFNMDELIELGAVEVISEYRGQHLASKLLEVAMMDNYMENYIVFSTEYYWHWDLDGTRLSIWKYRKVMEDMMNRGGLHPAPTDDPEIISHPANCLMVRIGTNVSRQSIEQFDKLRFLTRTKNRSMREGI